MGVVPMMNLSHKPSYLWGYVGVSESVGMSFGCLGSHLMSLILLWFVRVVFMINSSRSLGYMSGGWLGVCRHVFWLPRVIFDVWFVGVVPSYCMLVRGMLRASYGCLGLPVNHLFCCGLWVWSISCSLGIFCYVSGACLRLWACPLVV